MLITDVFLAPDQVMKAQMDRIKWGANGMLNFQNISLYRTMTNNTIQKKPIFRLKEEVEEDWETNHISKNKTKYK